MMELASLIFLTDVVLLFSKSGHFNATMHIYRSKCMLCTVLCSIINQLCSSTLMNFLAFLIFPVLFIYMHIYALRHNTYHISAYEPQWWHLVCL